MMSPETTNSETSTALVEVNPQPTALVETERQEEMNELQRETTALIEAIRKRAQSEMQSAGELSREAYLNAVRKARENIEQTKLIDPAQIEHSWEVLQQEADKNWHYILGEVESLGDRIADAAKAAWSRLMASPSDPD
ncbi:MAG: hypothetical protein VKJ46_15030 [Leptolyngbyaceae bacterium]|nr:hypothetical protein [Leptolyngbyaceae bacterium]